MKDLYNTIINNVKVGIPDINEIKKHPVVGLDIETFDPSLSISGSPGAARYLATSKLDKSLDFMLLPEDQGFITGVSIATKDQAWYMPIAHADNNVDMIKFREFMHQLIESEVSLVGANFIYDLQWLYAYGFKFKAPVMDVQIAESLIDENKFKYSLDSLAEKYFDLHKVDEIADWAQVLGIDVKYTKDGNISPATKKKVMGSMPNLTGNQVAKYAAIDAWLTLQVFNKQTEVLNKEGLVDIFQLETDITPIVLEMTMHGVKIDIERAEKYNIEMKKKEEELLRELYKSAGTETLEPWSAQSLKDTLDYLNIDYKLTAKSGAPSLTDDFLSKSDNTFLKTLHSYRKINKSRRDFLEGTLLDEHTHVKWYNPDGTVKEVRIHGQFHQNKKDDSGTVTGRFSSSNPNLQQQPSRDAEWKKIIRSCYVPDDGYEWIRYDYSQQELRVLLHYAVTNNKPGADKIAEEIRKNPGMDYHQLTADMAGITRRKAKDINFGINYGMGKAKLAANLGLNMDDASKLMALYDEKVPYARKLYYDVMNAANKRGFIKTLLGRKRHFDLWEPVKEKQDWENGTFYTPYPIERAREEYPNRRLQRAMTYKALNALIQGGSADMTKIGMLVVWQKYGVAPGLQVHDELDFVSLPSEYKDDVKQLMEHCIDLAVPIVADMEIGPSWGEPRND